MKKFTIFILAAVLIISGAFFLKNYYQRPLSKTNDFSFYAQPDIPDFLQGYVEEKGENFLSVKTSTNQVIKINLGLATTVKILSTTVPSTATESNPIIAEITDLKAGDTVSILLTKDSNSQKVIRQEITIIK